MRKLESLVSVFNLLTLAMQAGNSSGVR